MGYSSLIDMIEHAGPDVALEWHLSGNFYPPIDPGARECARKVYRTIKAGTYAPEEVFEWRMANDDYGTVSAGRVVSSLRMEPFLDYYAEVNA